jgi:tRNA(Ile)-lysidine synthase
MSPHLVDMDSENKLITALRESVDALGIPPTSVAPYILAISGGKDSMALMHIFAQVYGPSSARIVTIDHGIRPESAQEVICVEREARMLGYEVDIVSLALSRDTPSLEAHARDRRYTALDAYRSKYHASHIITAHHR